MTSHSESNAPRAEKTRFDVPARKNVKLKALLDRIRADAELRQLWKSANINAVDRSGISDHGEVHIRIVANAALRLYRLLVDGGVTPSCVQHHGLTVEDGEVIVVLAAALHDVGIGVHRDNHEAYSLILTYPKARALLKGLYGEPEWTIMVMEVQHAVISHRADIRCLTVEAGALKVADALDMTEGRSRIPFAAGEVNIHSVSAQAVASVAIEKGADRPVSVQINLTNSAGIFQIDELLRRKLANSSLESYIEVVAHIEGGKDGENVEYYRL